LLYFTTLPLTHQLLPHVLDIDQRCFGGLWSAEGYAREIDSPNSVLLVLVSGTQYAPLAALWQLGQTQLRQVQTQPDDRTVAYLDYPEALLAEARVHILGLACLWAILDEAHITTLAIAPEHHRLKLGQLLLGELLQCGCDRNLLHATLEVRISNQAALNLYQKFDFKTAGQRKRYYPNGEDALILWRRGLQEHEFQALLTQLRQESRCALQKKGWHWIEGDD
jgi:[ribosomal protein S18]-alanine N-acetyltransferase